jgi:hypothetical protein
VALRTRGVYSLLRCVSGSSGWAQICADADADLVAPPTFPVVLTIGLGGHHWQVRAWVVLLVVCVGWLVVDAWWDRRKDRRRNRPSRKEPPT